MKSGKGHATRNVRTIIVMEVEESSDARAVWEALVAGKEEDFISGLPDEFQGWARGVAERIAGDVMDQEAALEQEFWSVTNSLSPGFSRKDFAMKVAQSPNKWALFPMLDGQVMRPELLKRARPEANLFPSNLRCQSEDVA